MVSDTHEPIAASLDADRPEPAQPAGGPESGPARERIMPAAVWFVIVAGFLLFLAFGTVTLHYSGAHPKIAPPASARVVRVWLDQAHHLPRAARDWLVRAMYFVLLAVVLVSSAVVMWLALTAKSEPAATCADPPSLTDPPAPDEPEAAGESA